MECSRKPISIFRLILVMFAGAAVFAASPQSDELSDDMSRGAVVDQYGRVIFSPDVGKINYLLAAPGVDLSEKGSSKAISIVFTELPDETPAPFDGLGPGIPYFASKAATGSQPFHKTWELGMFGSSIGSTNLVAEDIDNDGIVEIIADGNRRFWYVLEYNRESGTYEMKWVSPYYTEHLDQLVVFDANDDGIFDIFIGLENGDIHIHDGGSLVKTGEVDTPTYRINRILFADGDNDDIVELMVCDSSGLYLYHPGSLALEHELPYGTDNFEVGNVDGDPGLEIVLSDGTVLEMNGSTAALEWDYPGGDFGRFLELADVDSDNILEIIGSSGWYYITAFDADVQSPKWEIYPSQDVNALLMADVDDNGVPDILYGDGQWGVIHCYDATTLVEMWSIDNPHNSLTNILVHDIDSDGELEIAWGSGTSYYSESSLLIHGLGDLALEWRSEASRRGPFSALDLGDVDSDGHMEIVTASRVNEYSNRSGFISIFDTVAHELEWRSDANHFGVWRDFVISDLEIANIDDDGAREIIVAADDSDSPPIRVFDGKTHEEENSYLPDDYSIYAIDVADVDMDGSAEIIAGGAIGGYWPTSVHIFVIDCASGEVEWKSIHLGNSQSRIEVLQVGDVDGDDNPEIVAIQDDLYIIDGVTHHQWQTASGDYHGLDLYDLNKDGQKDVIFGASDGYIKALDGETKQTILQFGPFAGTINGLRVRDMNSDGSAELIYTIGGSAWVYDTGADEEVWSSGSLSLTAGENDAMVIADIDSNRLADFIVGAYHKVVEFRQHSDIYVSAGGDCGGATPCFSTLAEGLDECAERKSSRIHLEKGAIDEGPITVHSNAWRHCKGGWNSSFTDVHSQTVIHGPLTLEAGVTVLENIVIVK